MATRTSSGATGRTSARSLESSVVSGAGSTSLRVEAICPSLTIIPPDSSSTVRTRWVRSGESSAAPVA